MASKAKTSQTKTHIAKPKRKRPGVHSKKKISKSKLTRNEVLTLIYEKGNQKLE